MSGPWPWPLTIQLRLSSFSKALIYGRQSRSVAAIRKPIVFRSDLDFGRGFGLPPAEGFGAIALAARLVLALRLTFLLERPEGFFAFFPDFLLAFLPFHPSRHGNSVAQ